MNNVKVFVLMAGLSSLFVAIGGYFGGQSGMIMALVFAGVRGRLRTPYASWMRERIAFR